jgi:hypothetical protein
MRFSLIRFPVIEKGAAMPGVSVEDLINDSIMGMRELQKKLG